MFVEKRFVRYLNNNSNILLDAPHSTPPGREWFTDEIARKIALELKFNCIISKVSRRTEADLNRDFEFPLPLQREARGEYISVIKELYSSLNRSAPYLHIAIHGMRNRDYKDIEIGTLFGEICSDEIENWFYKKLNEAFINRGFDLKIVRNQQFYGDISLKELKLDANYNIIQMELSKTLRTNYKDLVIDVFKEVLEEFNKLKFT